MEQKTDIVERLRLLVLDETGAINKERAEAADEIERLRGGLANLNYQKAVAYEDGRADGIAWITGYPRLGQGGGNDKISKDELSRIIHDCEDD